MATKIKVRIELADGKILDVDADQRDMAKAEAAEILPAKRLTWVRYVAWAAARRTSAYVGTWEGFNEVDCIEASDQPEASTVDEGLDPGRPGRGGANSSRSRSAPASR